MAREIHCSKCKNRCTIPGDAHITCMKPPHIQIKIGSGGKERYEQATIVAMKYNAVVRCVWPRSGMFPICFDGGTVFGCANFDEVT